MSVSYTPAQVGEIVINTVATPPGSPASVSITNGGGASAGLLLRYQFSTTIYFIESLKLSITLSGTFGSESVPPAATETFNVLTLQNPNLINPITTGTIDLSLVPTLFNLNGTAASYLLAQKTITSYGTVVFNLDLATITQIMMNKTNPWTGSLLLWVTVPTTQGNFLTTANSNTVTLIATGQIDYANRFTGLQGPWQARSRVDECPVCGNRSPRETWGYSPWHKRMVGIECVDPADPYDTPLVIETEDPLGAGEDE